jgi:hypothetical protein
VKETKGVDVRLNTVKTNFANETQKDVAKFRVDLEDFSKFFKERIKVITVEGYDLDGAGEEVKQHQAKLMELKSLREKLLEAEKMFDLPMNQYPVIREMELQIYGTLIFIIFFQLLFYMCICWYIFYFYYYYYLFIWLYFNVIM